MFLKKSHCVGFQNYPFTKSTIFKQSVGKIFSAARHVYLKKNDY